MTDGKPWEETVQVSQKTKGRRFSHKTLDRQATVSSQQTPAHESHSTSHRQPLELKGFKFNLTEDKILEEATLHNNYVYVDKSRLTGLPQFDSISTYDVKDEDHEKLLRLEIKNLIKAAELEGPYLFNSAGRLKLCNAASYEELSALGRRISLDISVIALDNATMVIENRPKGNLVSMAVGSIKHPYVRLRREYITGEKNRSTDPEPAEVSEASRSLYFALVDFVTGSIARLLIRTASSSYWCSQTLGLLARLAVKLKFLSKSSREYAHSAIRRVEDTIHSFQQSDENRTTIVIQEHVEGKGVEEKHLQMDNDLIPDELYFSEGFVRRGMLHGLFQAAISSLLQDPTRQRTPGDFRHHVVAYETGFNRSLVIVSEDRDGYVTTASAVALTKTCCRALTLVKENIENLHSMERPPSSSVHTDSATESCKISLNWAVKPQDNTKLPGDNMKWPHGLETQRVDSIVSVMVPLALSTPHVASVIEDLVKFSMADSTRKTDEPMRRFKHYPIEASCSVQTSINARMQKNTRKQDPDTVSINHSDLIGKLKAGGKIDSEWIEAITTDGTSNSARPHLPVPLQELARYNKEIEKMEEWVLATTNVTVRCKRFVFFILCFCAIMITGALLLPFFVKNKLPGVDPFQITTFTWLVAGVVLIVAKGRYVKEWPWHDFVHGRVVCESVSDLADVTGVDKQIILMKLLHNERSTALVTRGPYNGMFDRKSEGSSEGFAIDEPVQLSTMLASGFVILKVISYHGEHLICLDARKGNDLDYANSEASVSMKYLSCLEMSNGEAEEFVSRRPNRTSKTVLHLSENSIGWHKMVGLFVGDAVFG